MKKLYRVDVTVEMVVAAESQAEAEREAEYLVQVEDGGAEVIAEAFPLTSKRSPLPPDWGFDTIPFNSDNDKTIGEYLSETEKGGAA